MKRWRVRYFHKFMDGTGGECDPPTEHRTWLGADFHRRFRYHHLSLGSCWGWTEPERIDPSVTPMVTEQYEEALKRLWAVLSWLRSRWYGLRYGRDR